MSIQNEIDRIKDNIAAAYTVVEDKGGTLPDVQNSENLPEAIASIQQTSPVKIYGAYWDGSSTSKWTRTDDATVFIDPVPYTTGSTDYGSPFDGIQPWAGMVKTERTCGTMVAIPKFWYKISQVGAGMMIQIANKPVDGFFVSPAHMDRGDGNGERDVVYIGRYHSSADYTSKTGSMPRSGSMTTCRSGIHALGDDVWQMDFAMRFTIWLLYLVEFANWDSQDAIGYGCGDGSIQAVGYTDSMPYHTGTTKSRRTIYGLGTQYRNIEGLWDNVYDWMDGCFNVDNGINVILNPASFGINSKGVSIGVPASMASTPYPSAYSINANAGFPVFIPSAATVSISPSGPDEWRFESGDTVYISGGNYSRDLSRGIFCLFSIANVSGSDLSCRIQELP